MSSTIHRPSSPTFKLPDMQNLRQQGEDHTDVENTACSTLRSRSSSLLSGAVGSNSRLGSFTSINNGSHFPQDPLHQQTKKERLSSFFSRVKIRTRQWSSRRRKSISEPNLRKKLKKYADRGDWDTVKKLLSKYSFADIPIISEPIRDGSSHEGSGADRRPSYGSRNSLTGKESAAAAAAIKAAQFDESSSAALSSERLDLGENVLHDMCRCHPPPDVIELLLSSLPLNRRGYTSGRDEVGRTPLHVAAACGASPDVVEALAQADPSPASSVDVNGRTPLHIAVMYLAYNRRVDSFQSQGNKRVPPSTREEEPFDEEAREQAATSIFILKEAMMAFPGKVDFKDDDKMGYSPLDYAIDGNISDDHVLHCLLRRKGLNASHRRSTATAASNDTQVANNYYKPMRRRSRLDSDVSSTCSQDISVLLRLEEEEMAAHKEKVEKMRTKHQKVKIQSTLFDMFGIDEEHGQEPPRVQEKVAENEHQEAVESPNQQPERAENVSETNDVQQRRRRSSRRLPQSTSLRSNLTSSSSRRRVLRDSFVQNSNSMNSADIYNAHLDAYLNGLVNEHLDLRDDDDSFDIFHDPEEDVLAEEEGVGLNDSSRDSSRIPIFEIDIQLDVRGDNWNDDFSQCSRFDRSVVSEVSVPAILVNMEA